MITPADRSRAPLVLIVDDEPPVHELLHRLLAPHGFTTSHAHSVSEAVRAVEAHVPDAVVLDLRLSSADDGIDFLAWLRAQPAFTATPVLILTGLTQIPEDDEALIRRHRAYVFYKPELSGKVVEYLKRLTEGA